MLPIPILSKRSELADPRVLTLGLLGQLRFSAFPVLPGLR